jgi:Tfp pilus assembly PilM family ATPase
MLKINLKKINFFAGKSNNEIIALDLCSQKLKLAHANVVPNKKEIINLSCNDISALDEADVPKSLHNAIIELEAKSPEFIDTIPSHLVITKNIEIPSTNQKEIREIINLQAGRHTPYSREEIIVDYIDIGTYKHSYTKILLVIVSRSVVKKHIEIVEKAGFRLSRILFAPECIALNAAKLLKIETEAAPVAIAHVDEFLADFIIVLRNKAIFTRPIPIGTSHLLSEEEKYTVKFLEEVKRSLDAYQSEDIEKNPNLLVLTGALQDVSKLESTLKEGLHLPVRAAEYLKNTAILDKALACASVSRHSSFLNVIAPALSFREAKINLIPDEAKLRRAVEERGKELIKTGILILSVFVLIFFILASKIYFKSAYLARLTDKYAPINNEAKELEGAFEKISLVKGYLARRGYSLEVLTELYKVITPEIQISDIRFDGLGKFAIRGTAESMSVVFSFVDNMSKSKYFTDVKNKYTTNRKDGSRDVTDFEINAQLSPKVSE